MEKILLPLVHTEGEGCGTQGVAWPLNGGGADGGHAAEYSWLKFKGSRKLG